MRDAGENHCQLRALRTQRLLRKDLLKEQCWSFSSASGAARYLMRFFQQLLQQSIPERIDEHSVGEVPQVKLNVSLCCSSWQKLSGGLFRTGCREIRTMEHPMGGSCPSDFGAHTLQEDRVAPQIKRRAMKPLTAHLTRGAPLSFQLH